MHIVIARLSRKSLIVYILLLLMVAAFSCMPSLEMDNGPDKINPQSVSNYTFIIINAYPHDRDAYTQGLTVENGTLFESTGLYARSSLRRVDLTSGNVLQIYELPDEYFGEGITVFRDTIIQLTWRSKKGFVYNKNSFEVIREFTYETGGWGITNDEKHLIMSNGSSTLYFLDAGTFQIRNHIQVHDDDKLINNLNELEFIDGQIYANIWGTENIAIIDPQDGRVTGWIDLSGILPPQFDSGSVDILNGTAYDVTNGHLLVTGKLWPQLFEIELMIIQ